MKRIFDQSDVDRWMERLDQMNLSIQIDANEVVHMSPMSYEYNINSTHDVLAQQRKLNYSFCVRAKELEKFNHILKLNYNREFIIYLPGNGYKNDKSINGNVIDFKKSNIKIHGVDYVLHETVFNVPLQSILMHISHIEDVFTSIDKYYEIDDKGVEKNTLPFQLHDVVSYNDTKDHTEYLIRDILFDREELTYSMSQINEKMGKTLLLRGMYHESPEVLRKSRGSKLTDLIRS
jgi:hypothetical protein